MDDRQVRDPSLTITQSIYRKLASRRFVPGADVIEESGSGFTPFNRFGEHFWFVDLDMDCSAAENGWFEFKVLLNTNIYTIQI